MLLVAQFVYLLIRDVISRVYSTVLRISGELVANHIRIRLMTKSKEVDLASYDSPEYYTKFENATREAARRPIESLTATFSILSTVISIVSYVVIILAIGILTRSRSKTPPRTATRAASSRSCRRSTTHR